MEILDLMVVIARLARFFMRLAVLVESAGFQEHQLLRQLNTEAAVFRLLPAIAASAATALLLERQERLGLVVVAVVEEQQLLQLLALVVRVALDLECLSLALQVVPVVVVQLVRSAQPEALDRMAMVAVVAVLARLEPVEMVETGHFLAEAVAVVAPAATPFSVAQGAMALLA
jgi:hypothetical protein